MSVLVKTMKIRGGWGRIPRTPLVFGGWGIRPQTPGYAPSLPNPGYTTGQAYEGLPLPEILGSLRHCYFLY